MPKVPTVIICRLVPVVRAVRRAIVARPRLVVAAAAGAAIRRVPRPMMLVCRDAGLGGLLLATAAAAPLPDRAAVPEPLMAMIEAAAPAVAVEPLWRGPWGGFPPPMTPTALPEADARRPAGEMPLPLLTGSPAGGGSVAVPEPSSLALFALGLLAAPFLRRRPG